MWDTVPSGLESRVQSLESRLEYLLLESIENLQSSLESRVQSLESRVKVLHPCGFCC